MIHVCLVWPYVALYGLVWPYVALCGLMWPYVALCGLEWPYVALCGLKWPWRVSFGLVMFLISLLVDFVDFCDMFTTPSGSRKFCWFQLEVCIFHKDCINAQGRMQLLKLEPTPPLFSATFQSQTSECSPPIVKMPTLLMLFSYISIFLQKLPFCNVLSPTKTILCIRV